MPSILQKTKYQHSLERRVGTGFKRIFQLHLCTTRRSYSVNDWCFLSLYSACVSDLPVVSNLCNESYTDLTVALQIPTGEEYGIVVSKDNPQLTAAINEALKELEEDGTMDELQTKWFGQTI